jgi:superfamily II DNA or RNA helicase
MALSAVQQLVAQKTNEWKHNWNESLLGPFDHIKIKFKRCINETFVEAFVVLYIPSHIKTNENRKSVIDKRFAKHRAEKAWCLLVLDMFRMVVIHKIDYYQRQYGVHLLYETNTWVLPNGYTADEETVCGQGVHFFNRIEPAHFFQQWKMPYFFLNYFGKEVRAIAFGDQGEVTHIHEHGHVTETNNSKFKGTQTSSHVFLTIFCVCSAAGCQWHVFIYGIGRFARVKHLFFSILEKKMKVIKVRYKKRFHPYPRKKPKPRLRKKKRPITRLFPFQESFLHVADQKIQEKYTKFILVSAVGTGKTVMGCTFMQRNGWNGLFLTPDAVYDHILYQCHQHFPKHVKINPTTNGFEKYDVTILSFSQFTRLDLEHSLFYHKFQTVIVDEIATISHKKSLLNHLKKVKSIYWLGLTGLTIHLETEKLPHFDQHCFVYENKNIKLALPEHRLISHDLPQELKAKYNEIIDQQQAVTTTTALFLHLRKLVSQYRVPFLVNKIKELAQPAKIVIFSEFNETLLSLQLHLHVPKIDSSTPKHTRFQLLLDFAKTDTGMLLCSRSIVGIGNDLGFVDVLIIAEPAYNRVDDLQLIGRITRLGQCPKHYPKQLVWQFLYLGSCEDKLYQCKQAI